MADLREMAYARLSRIGFKSESVAIRQCCHVRFWRSSGYRDPGDALHEVSAHLIGGLVRTLLHGSPACAPFDVKRVNDPPYLIDWSIHAHDAVGNRERIEDTYISCMEAGASIIKVRVSAPVWKFYSPENVRC
jgi:hypothetical protein